MTLRGFSKRRQFMSNITSLIRRAPKRLTAAIAMIAAAIIVPAAVMAWGPDRPTFTMNNPSDHVAFNSITDNPNIGDERNFVGIRPDNGDNGVNNTPWTDNEPVTGGQTYIVRMYVHNNAASNLNLVAQNVTAKFNVPNTTGKSVQVDGFLSTSNWGANNSGNAGAPYEIYDSATFTSSQDFNITYIPGSALFENNSIGANGGVTLPDSLVTSTGDKLGYDHLDGKIPGCMQYAGYVTFKVKVQTANNFTFSKEVSKHGASKFTDNYTAQPGETVDYLLRYKNTSANQQNDVTLRDTLPAGMTYVNGSTTVTNAAVPNGAKVSDNIATGTGVNIGTYAAGANGYAIFSATVPTADKLTCGTNTLVNTGKATVSGYSISDTATVTVNKTCQPGTISVCNLATKQIVTINENDFDSSKYSKDLSKCVELPHTGPATTVLGIVGLGAIVASLGYFIASRRALNGGNSKNL
jgi:uncharacterized repeat protein (TIGR01451 family)